MSRDPEQGAGHWLALVVDAARLREVGEGMRPDDPVSRARVAAEVRAVFDSLDPDTRTQLETTLASLRPEGAVEAEYESLFAAAIEVSKNEGRIPGSGMHDSVPASIYAERGLRAVCRPSPEPVTFSIGPTLISSASGEDVSQVG